MRRYLAGAGLPSSRERRGAPHGERDAPPKAGELSQCSTQSSGKIRGFHGAWEARQRAVSKEPVLNWRE